MPFKCERNVGNYTFFFRRYSPLSNFYHCKFKDRKGVKYCCSEQYYQYHKALIYSDLTSASKIIHSTNPAYIKRCGREVKGYRNDVKRWQRKYARKVMRRGLRLKFTQNPSLAKHLLRSNRIIAEANPYDNYFGIGKDMYSSDVEKQSSWRGRNIQGKLLMELRRSLEDDA